MNSPSLMVFYDGGCPLCSREIAHYRLQAGAEDIVWLDVTDPGFDAATYGIDKVAAMKEFHVLSSGGQLALGADGFLALWDELPRYRWLAQWCRRLGMVPLMRWGYRHFAQWHFGRRCRDGACAAG